MHIYHETLRENRFISHMKLNQHSFIDSCDYVLSQLREIEETILYKKGNCKTKGSPRGD